MARKITAAGLKPSVNTEDKDFMNKLATIEALTQKFQQSTEGEKPSLILVRMSVTELRNAHKDTPTANAEAADLLAQQLGQFSDAAQKYFGDSVLVAAVASSSEHSNRQRRDTPTTAPKQTQVVIT